MFDFWAFDVDDRSESSCTNEMIIYQYQDLLRESGIIMNFIDQIII
jgi:hypothetical protein